MEHFLMLFVLCLLHINGDICMDIFRGKEAAPHSRPYMALLQKKGKPDRCGGALIKPNWILTAAHCEFQTNGFAVLGAHRLNDTGRQQSLPIKRGITHPCYDKSLKMNDIQLLELQKPATLNKFVALLGLPKTEENVKDGEMCSVAGWGVIDPKKNVLADVLREANLTIVNNDKCNKIYSKRRQVITKSMLCAGPLKKHKEDTCSGDSGGPLLCNKKYVGIVSFGTHKCGNPEFPGVYTRLTNNYVKWIKDTIGGSDSETYMKMRDGM